jgi:pilus assembly protein Flp/PilA
MNKLFTKAQNAIAIRKMELEEAEEGAAMVEYGLLVVGIAVVVGAAALTLGGRIAGLFNGIIPAP